MIPKLSRRKSLVTTALAIDTNTPEVIEAKFRQVGTAVALPAPQLLDALRPAERVALLTEISNVVKDVIEKQGWYKQIGPKKHIFIQGWTFIGGLGGCSAKTVSTEKIDGGYKAHAVVVRVDTGIEVGAADQVCMSSESKWKGKDDYALTGMASTRACSRALSTVFRHVVELAGYSATPAEEMTYEQAPEQAPMDEILVRPAVVAEINALAEVLHFSAERLAKGAMKMSGGTTEVIANLLPGQADTLLAYLKREAAKIKGKPCEACGATVEADGLTIEHKYDGGGKPCPNDVSEQADLVRHAIAKLGVKEDVVPF